MTDADYRTSNWLRRLSGLALLWLVLAIMLYPFVEMISTSLKSKPALSDYPPVWFPAEPIFRNYIELWSTIPLAAYIRNSIIIAGGATLLNGLAAVPAAYALARFRFPGRQTFLHMIVATQMFSPVVLLLATFRMMFDFGLLNTYWSVIFVNATVALPFTIWMLTAYFSTIPREIEEAALLDNAGRWRMLADHFVPIAMPGIVTAMTFSFIIAWNEFLFAVTFITDQRLRPLTTGIYTFVGRTETLWNFLMAASLISIVPVFIGFLLVQRRLVSGLAAGAVK
jgi:multiple sugar transport system permease protein